MNKTDESFVNPESTRNEKYRKVLNEICNTGKCPFCPKNFVYHKKPILKKQGGWFITENNWPYPNTKHHLVIISEKHKTNLGELNSKDFIEIFSLAKWAAKKLNISGGAVAFRFGDPKLTGASVTHLHVHIISPNVRANKKNEPVLFHVG